eukprot:m.166537 g.166537  ORF g.166537 m.166537 type:complete len:50 (+) comp16437_c0_seq22:828-977(+)
MGFFSIHFIFFELANLKMNHSPELYTPHHAVNHRVHTRLLQDTSILLFG